MTMLNAETETPSTDVWASVVGQHSAVGQLSAAATQPVHAYMLLGPRGSGKRAAARAFAALLLSEGLEGEAADRARRLALGEQHPDLIVFEPNGRTITIDEATPVITEASRTPVEAVRKVIVIDQFHTAENAVVGKLLKTIEEPVATTVIVVLTEDVPPDHITIASRCVTVEFWPIAESVIEAWLSKRGVRDPQAAMVAAFAQGDLRRASLLTTDPQLAERHTLWVSVPSRLNGTGARVCELVAELITRIDEAQETLNAQHKIELVALDEREEQFGMRGSGRRDVIARQKREIRKHRDAEFTFGFSTMSGVYRDQLFEHPRARDVAAVDRLRTANEMLSRNPSEELMLQALLLDLPVP